MRLKEKPIPYAIVRTGKFIRDERLKQKMSLEKLSLESFGNSNMMSVISLIERGKKPHVEFLTIYKIFKALGYIFV